MKGFEDFPQQYMPILIAMMIMAFAVVALVYTLYLSNLYKLLSVIKPENRQIKPALVWLIMLTFVDAIFIISQLFLGEFEGTLAMLSKVVQYGMQVFILVFQFYMVNKIADSIEAEYRSRNLPVEPRPTYQMGLIMCVCSAATLVSQVPVLSFLSKIAALVGLVVWIMYWVKTAEWKNKIKFLPQDNDGESDLFKNLY